MNIMKSVIFALALTVTPATAQSSFLFFFSLPAGIELPTTRSWVDSNGKVLGTATFHENKVYLRDSNGKHVATVIPSPSRDGVIYLDERGKVIEGRKDPVHWAK
jgi:hypothetical protein